MRRVLVSVHDVTPRHFARLQAIDARLAGHGLAGRYAALIVPNFRHEWPLADHPDFVAWLRERIAAGVEPVLHGYYHRDERPPAPASAWERLRARALPGGAGEFHGLDREAARARIVAGRRVLAEHLGAEVDAFVAPAWLYSQATHEILGELGFAIAEDQLRVWSPAAGDTLTRGPVLSYVGRGRLRIAAAWLTSRAATALLGALPTLRVAIHPGEVDAPALERELDRALAALLRGRAPTRYRELLA